MTLETERRSLVLPVERRADGDGKGNTVAGYAVVFDSEADIGGYFREKVARGAFTESLKTSDVLAYFDHDRGRVLGRSSAGTLRLTEDDKGLAVEIDLPDTTDGRDVRELIDRGDISGMSFGFIVTRQEWDETVDPPTRTIHAVELREVSIVSEPAYGDTSIALRSRDAARQEQREHPAKRRVDARRAAMEQRFRRI
ncbi:peptidase U35 [Sphingobium jiangsuense]|nr:HK97 family phage prohead protease [Sphingobium jiangsuense]GLT01798.1 peptidase U35 [Sphingobium jiangsuense]